MEAINTYKLQIKNINLNILECKYEEYKSLGGTLGILI